MDMQQVSKDMREGKKMPFSEQVRLIVSLSVPAVLEQLVMTFMSYIDTAMVGSLGYQATAAIGVVVSSIWLLNGVVGAVAVGFSVQVAQYLGAGREEESRDVLCQSILFNVVFGVLIAVLALAVGQVLPKLLGAEAEIQPLARDYFCMVAAFLPFSLASTLYSSIYRCSGNVMVPSLMNVGMCVLDIIFNFFLIYPTREIGGMVIWGAGLGVKGAALGTGLAQACTGVAMLWLLVHREGPLKLTGKESWRFNKICMKNTGLLAIPTALERMTLNGAQIVMSMLITQMGSVAVAANYVAVQSESICYLPAYGISAAATALVGQSIGAGRKDMAKRFAYGTVIAGFLLVFATSIVLFLGASQFSSLLTNEAEVVDLSARTLQIIAFAEPLFAVSIVASGALRGAGDGKGPFLINLCSMWCVRVLSVVLFTRRYGIIGVWATMAVELSFRGILFAIRLVRGRWLEKAGF